MLKTKDKAKYDLLDWAVTKMLNEHELQRTRAMLKNTSMWKDHEKVFAVAKTGNYRRNSKNVRCWKCGEQGHIKGQCRKPIENGDNRVDKAKHAPTPVNAGTQLCWETSNAQESWLISGIWNDSGATSHMFGDSQLLKSSMPLNTL